MAQAEILQPHILSWEGGFVNDPADAGGATNKGITLATYRRVFGNNRTVADLKKMTDYEWLLIFKKYYWDKWKADQINDQSIANLLVGWVWGSGKYGITIPQKLLGVVADGIVGAKTLAAVNNYPDQKKLFDLLKARKEKYLRDICVSRPANKKFLKGWLRRLNSYGYGWYKLNNGKLVNF